MQGVQLGGGVAVHQGEHVRRQAVGLGDAGYRQPRVAGLHRNQGAGLVQPGQQLAHLLVGGVAEDEHGRQLARGGQVEQLPLPLLAVLGLVVGRGQVDAVVAHQLPVAHQHPLVLDPAGVAHGVFVGKAVVGQQDVGAVFDHLHKHRLQVGLPGAEDAGRLEDGLVDPLPAEGLDAVQQHAPPGEEVGVADHQPVEVVQPLHRRVARQHPAVAVEGLAGAAEGDVEGKHQREGGRQAKQQGEGPRRPHQVLLEEVEAAAHRQGEHQADARRHPRPAVGGVFGKAVGDKAVEHLAALAVAEHRLADGQVLDDVFRQGGRLHHLGGVLVAVRGDEAVVAQHPVHHVEFAHAVAKEGEHGHRRVEKDVGALEIAGVGKEDRRLHQAAEEGQPHQGVIVPLEGKGVEKAVDHGGGAAEHPRQQQQQVESQVEVGPLPGGEEGGHRQPKDRHQVVVAQQQEEGEGDAHAHLQLPLEGDQLLQGGVLVLVGEEVLLVLGLGVGRLLLPGKGLGVADGPVLDGELGHLGRPRPAQQLPGVQALGLGHRLAHLPVHPLADVKGAGGGLRRQFPGALLAALDKDLLLAGDVQRHRLADGAKDVGLAGRAALRPFGRRGRLFSLFSLSFALRRSGGSRDRSRFFLTFGRGDRPRLGGGGSLSPRGRGGGNRLPRRLLFIRRGGGSGRFGRRRGGGLLPGGAAPGKPLLLGAALPLQGQALDLGDDGLGGLLPAEKAGHLFDALGLVHRALPVGQGGEGVDLPVGHRLPLGDGGALPARGGGLLFRQGGRLPRGGGLPLRLGGGVAALPRGLQGVGGSAPLGLHLFDQLGGRGALLPARAGQRGRRGGG